MLCLLGKAVELKLYNGLYQGGGASCAQVLDCAVACFSLEENKLSTPKS